MESIIKREMPPSGHLMRHRKTKYTKGPDRFSTTKAIYHIFLRLSIHYFCIYANFFTSVCVFSFFCRCSLFFARFLTLLTDVRAPISGLSDAQKASHACENAGQQSSLPPVFPASAFFESPDKLPAAPILRLLLPS